MKKFLQIVVAAAVALAVATPTFAADKGKKKRDPNAPRTISGKAVCPKCQLKEDGAACGNAIQITRKGKDGKEQKRIYYVVGAVAKENHSLFCKGNKRAKVTGTVKYEGKGKDRKAILTATKVEEAKGKGKGKGKGKKKDA